jgi:hypothetical protein
MLMKKILVKLTIIERDRLPAILPPKGKHELGRLCVSIRQKAALTQAERKKYKVQYMRDPQGGFSMMYDIKKDRGETIVFTSGELFLIGGRLKQIEAMGDLPTPKEWVSLYDKFVRFGKDANGRKKGKQQEAPRADA